MNKKTVSNSIRADELFLCAINDERLAPQIQRAIQTLRGHYTKGEYSIEKAIDLWMVLATREAQMYTWKFCDEHTRYYYLFNHATRKETATRMEEYYREQVVEG